jgi:hypothetical protein
MGKVKQLGMPRRRAEKGKAPPSLLERAMAEVTPGQALRAIFLAAQRLNWKVMLPAPPGVDCVRPEDEVVGIVVGRETYVAHVLQCLAGEHTEAYRLALEKKRGLTYLTPSAEISS